MADTGYARSPKLLKGALIEFSSRFLGPIPNIIIFQYNPETLSRSLNPFTPKKSEDGETAEDPGTAAPFDPEESFTLNLELDATDALEKPETHPVAFLTGVADRIAAMEMLLYPDPEGSLLGDLAAAVGSALGGGGDEPDTVPRTSVPIVMLVWGPGRIVPVRLTTFSVEEQAFSPILYPIHAKVGLGLQVLTKAGLEGYADGMAKDFAKVAYDFTKTQKEVLAMANLANSVESILGMLPF